MKMKFFNNVKLRLSISLMALAMVFSSCEDEDKAPIVTFDSAGHGIYPRLLSSSGDLLVNLLTESDFNSSPYSYTVEFVDDNAGQNVAEVYVEVTYSPVSGDDIGPLEVLRVPASSLTESESGFLQTTLEVNSTTLSSVVGLGYADYSPGDEFQIATVIVNKNGIEHRATNSSSSVRGVAFRGGNSAFVRPLACPSDLAGTFNFVNNDVFCDGSTTSGTVDIEAQGGGVYTFSDFSFGGYQECYGINLDGLTFTEVCEVVSFTNLVSSFSERWSIVSSISGEEWTLTGTNEDFAGESFDAVVTIPGGVPFTLAD